ncbi:FAD-binding oxidoreductase [Ectothiorhodospira variabilis]|uniref:FAD-binding oxidoreductase n=1 Tax=Ectothiorhodospira variabilis TaxID=505694 RepID=UPI001EFBABCD|nr:FAD-binding protein [Ectothiorhodospira variabilis]MCG5495944.1 FAD-binding protein [Ectothiorhodospira variabilis]MCG5505356.1 FAD-binding protein [Ectothiorhodospira variabilis]MCG5508542.1 FAD-binding protein [Ectothiorhodospira variabilis]
MNAGSGLSFSNVTGSGHEPSSILYPKTSAEIVEIVQEARRSKTPLYPVSTGLNWGYGSQSPIVPESVVVKLSEMRGILNADEISIDHPIALIEPGVTQGQLSEFLSKRCPELTFNVTGSSAKTSIIGCALDRGVGYFGPRKEDIFGLEFVAGTGEVIRTGFRRLGDDSPLAQCHPYGLGPIIDGLLFQSNYGIVTSACLSLRQRRPVEVAVSLSLRNPRDLGAFITELARLKREGLLTSVTHIGNRDRNHSTLMYGITKYLEKSCGLSSSQAEEEARKALSLLAPHEWTSLASVTGNKGQVKACLAEIRSRTKHLARLLVVTSRKLDLGFSVMHALRFISLARSQAAAIHAMRPLHDLALGKPTDLPIQNLLWKFKHPNLDPVELDMSDCGLLFVNPALPLDGEIIADVVDEMRSIGRRYNHPLYMTLNIETNTSLVAVVNLLFNRADQAEVRRAHECASALLDYILSVGLAPYRARVDMMGRIVSEDDPFWIKARDLKKVFDPDNIISPGRYNLL